MDFRHFEYVAAVADTGSISKAAEQLYISQPSLSHQIAEIEKRLDVKLFDRSSLPLKLTYAGELFMEHAREALRIRKTMDAEFRDLAGSRRGRLRLGVPHERAAAMLPLILPDFQRIYPDVEVQAELARSSHLTEFLRKGRLDFALMPKTGPLPRDCACETVSREPLLLACRAGQFGSLPAGTPVKPEQLQDCPLIASKKGHALWEAVSAFFEKENIRPRIVFRSDSNITALRLAAVGMGAAIVPQATVELAKIPPGGALHPIGEEPLAWDVALFFRRDAYLGEIEKAFIERARKVFQKGPSA